MKDIIYRGDAIKAIEDVRCWLTLASQHGDMGRVLWDEYYIKFEDAIEALLLISSADRPQGGVDAVDIFERETHNLEQGYITIGEFDERIEPLRHLCYGRPQGEWIKDEDGTYRCSNCGGCEEQYIYGTENWYGCGESKFCPSCGAKMKRSE